MENDKVMVYIYLIKFIVMKVIGKIIVFMEMVDFLKIINCFFKDSFKMDLNMVMVNTNILMGISLKENTLRIKKEAKEGILLIREEFYNLILILILPRFLKFHYLMVPLIMVSKKMV